MPRLYLRLCFSRWWPSFRTWLVYLFLIGIFVPQLLVHAEENTTESLLNYVTISITYTDEANREISKQYNGRLGKHSRHESVSGIVVWASNVVVTKSAVKVSHEGCTSPYSNSWFPSQSWIAFVQRGNCSFADKIRIAIKDHNASAIVIYDNRSESLSLIMGHSQVPGVVAVLISFEDGQAIVEMLKKDYNLSMTIKPSHTDANNPSNLAKSSVLFVSISFIVLMIVSLAWLIFYYVQRFRYSHAKERLARRLTCAAKKAITKIPQRTLKIGDKELDSEIEQCAVCIEPYKHHDVIRILPCRHIFHKSCVDPWLLDQRTCPMCKMDILRAYGMKVVGSRESLQADATTHLAPAVAIITTTNSVEEPGPSSSLDDPDRQNVNVTLVPASCLYFCSTGDGDSPQTAPGADSLAASFSSAPSISKCSPQKQAAKYKAVATDAETQALIGGCNVFKVKHTSLAGADEEDNSEECEDTSGSASIVVAISESDKNHSDSRL